MPSDSVNSEPQTNDNTAKNNSQSKQVEFHLGVFFDGTNNNKWNIFEYQAYKKYKKFVGSGDRDKFYKNNNSYLQGLSNVAKFSNVFSYEDSDSKVISHVYIDGIGTAARLGYVGFDYFLNKKNNNKYEDVTMKGKAFGTGVTGINAKVARGCSLICNELLNYSWSHLEVKEINLHLYVMGFSRGAAAARRFVSCINQTKGDVDSDYEECLKDKLKKIRLLNFSSISVDFLGLYDTVSSYGFWKTLVSYSDNVKQLALNLNNFKPKYVYQICAGDEYRDHFSLTRILSASEKEEIIIPGAHSDVGGGYEQKKDDSWRVAEVRNIPSGPSYAPISSFDPEKDVLYTGYKTKSELLDEGWFTQEDIKRGGRQVYDSYSLIPFLLMSSKIEKKVESVTLLDKTLISFYKYNESGVPKALSEIKTAIFKEEFYTFIKGKSGYSLSKANEKGEEMLKKIRRNFIHLSAEGGISDGPATGNIRVVVDDNCGSSGGGGGR